MYRVYLTRFYVPAPTHTGVSRWAVLEDDDPGTGLGTSPARDVSQSGLSNGQPPISGTELVLSDSGNAEDEPGTGKELSVPPAARYVKPTIMICVLLPGYYAGKPVPSVALGMRVCAVCVGSVCASCLFVPMYRAQVQHAQGVS